MKILVLNSGSSSIKYKLFDSENFEFIYGDTIENVKDFHKSFENIFTNLQQKNIIKDINQIKAVGHRVVHGANISKPTIITKKNIKFLESISYLAPLHNPSNIDGIKIVSKILPNVTQVAIFDTAFHQTIKKQNYIYPIPFKFYKKNKFRKYGFHGTSYHYLLNQFAKIKNKKRIFS